MNAWGADERIVPVRLRRLALVGEIVVWAAGAYSLFAAAWFLSHPTISEALRGSFSFSLCIAALGCLTKVWVEIRAPDAPGAELWDDVKAEPPVPGDPRTDPA